MDDAELRELVRRLCEVLDDVVADPSAAKRIRAAIDRALALPRRRVSAALWRVLTSDDAVLAWAESEVAGEGRVFSLDARGWSPGAGAEIASYEEPLDGGTVPAGPVRHLAASMPERVAQGRTLSLVVRITGTAPAGVPSSALAAFDVPPGGATVTVVVSSRGLTPRDEVEHDLRVPPVGDSEPCRFGFVATTAGRHTVTVDAYRGGTHLGGLRLEVVVEIGAAASEGTERTAELSSVAFEPGEVTLQVSRSPGGHTFQLLGEPVGMPVTSEPRGDVDDVVAALAAELSAMAAQSSAFDSAEQVRRRIRSLGVQLWTAALPQAVREQFWEQADRISSFSVVADHDTVPWELLYPLDPQGEDRGFLAAQFPVMRRSYAQRRVTRLPIGSAGYVVPPGSPANAREEIEAVRARLGAGVGDRGTISGLDDLDALLADVPGIVHFACHNTFRGTTGSVITLDGGPWRPGDLAPAAATGAFSQARPLVFLNACRTAGETTWLDAMNGWASSFVDAGAGAFVGSLWAVRSSSALTFAEEFYRSFVSDGHTLGESALHARRAVSQDDGDPTWLAYTVYGNPAATAS